ncbi:MAG: glycine-rich domain-containing protein, partial [Ilumatobacteraceae bacterium]
MDSGSCNWTVPSGVTKVDVLAVGGGGGGGAWVGGGGGGGGVTYDSQVSVTAGAAVEVTVGAGGVGASKDEGGTFVAGGGGGTSTFGSPSPVSALGGGSGASWNEQAAGAGAAIASGGGGSQASGTYAGGDGATSDGGSAPFDTQPHPTGGGGGAGGYGEDGSGTSCDVGVGGNGGPGVASDITGASVYYGGGGGGAVHGVIAGLGCGSTNIWGTSGAGGIGGGGIGASPTSLDDTPTAAPGTDGLGGGGGGAAGPHTADPATSTASIGGDGGDGVVIIRYLSASLSLSAGGAQQPSDYVYSPSAADWKSVAPKVQLIDASGNVSSTAGVSVTASLTTTSGSATLSGGTVSTDGSGVADFSSLIVNGDAGSTFTLTFSATGYRTVKSTQVSIVKATPIAQAWADDTVAFGDDTYLVPPQVDGVGGDTSLSGTWSYASDDSTVAGVDDWTGIVTANAAGEATITGTFTPSSSNYTNASATMVFTVTKANQDPLIFVNDDTIVYGTSLPIIVAGGSGSGNGSLSVTGSGCSVSGSVLTASGMGPCVLTAGKEGDANFFAAATVDDTVTVIKADQTVFFTSTPPLMPRPNGTYAVSAKSTSGLSVALSVALGSSAVCTLIGGEVTFTTSGACTITAVQMGDSNFNAAAPVAQTIDVGKLNQSITFAQPADRDFGDPVFALSATASSGLPAVFTTQTPAVCQVSGADVSIVAAGTCTIRASQAGDVNYSAAPDVDRS